MDVYICRILTGQGDEANQRNRTFNRFRNLETHKFEILNNLRVNNFGSEFWESLKKTLPTVSFIALVSGWLYFAESGNETTITLKIVLPVFTILIIIIIALCHLSRRLYSKASRQHPRVISCEEPPALHPKTKGTLLLEPSTVYGYDSMVSIYYFKQGCERLIGIGFVENVQRDGIIQVVVSSIESAYRDDWKNILQNDNRVLPNLLVKPSFPRMLLPQESFFEEPRIESDHE